jgi:glycosyltransferase involved in cell wall biosynthesis
MKFSIIIPTLIRPTLRDTLIAVENQTLELDRDYEVIVWSSGRNEYDARNMAAKVAEGEILAFVDDDAYPARDWLENALKHFQQEKLMVLTGPVEGNLYGQGIIRISNPGWYIGTNMFVRKDAFFELGGFEVDWGLNPCPRGWRSDSDLGFRAEDRFGAESCRHYEDVIVYHPGKMQSVWDPRVEEKFYLRHRSKVLERFVHVDPRLCQYLLHNQIEKDPETVALLTNLLKNFEKQYGIRLLDSRK